MTFEISGVSRTNGPLRDLVVGAWSRITSQVGVLFIETRLAGKLFQWRFILTPNYLYNSHPLLEYFYFSIQLTELIRDIKLNGRRPPHSDNHACHK